MGEGAKSKRFEFDAVLGHDCSQKDVYDLAAMPVVEDFLQGLNGTVLTYGQTGSGYTMEGVVDDEDHRGLLPRSITAIFQAAKDKLDRNEATIRVQFLEVHDEKIRDLLSCDRENLRVREPREGVVYVEGASSHSVSTEEDVLRLVAAGAAARKAGVREGDFEGGAGGCRSCTAARSHSVFMLELTQVDS